MKRIGWDDEMGKVVKTDKAIKANAGKRKKMSKRDRNLWIQRLFLVGVILSLVVSMFAPMFM